MSQYLILASRPGVYRTEPGPECQPVAAFDYLWCGRLRARYLIARLDMPARVRVVDEGEPPTVNLVPTRFMPSYASVQDAHAELLALVRGGGAESRLVEAMLA